MSRCLNPDSQDMSWTQAYLMHLVDVETWFERDRSLVAVFDTATGDYHAAWWDDKVEGMFDDGFFKTGRRFKESVGGYLDEIGLPLRSRPSAPFDHE